jgi:hypothetical protein
LFDRQAQTGTNAVKVKACGESAMKRVWKKVVIVLMTGVLAVGLLAYSKRHTIIIWHLQENNETQEMVIIEMLKKAKPIIERELNITLPENIYIIVSGDRNEKDRRIDALADVRTFVELC